MPSESLGAQRRGNVLLRNASFRRFWFARSASHLGDGASLIALLLYVKEIEHSGIAIGALLLAQSLPHLLGPVVGAAVDRFDLKWLMVGCELTQALIFAGMAWWLPGFPVLLGLVAIASVLDTTFSPASNSAVPTLVEEPDLLQANAWVGSSLNLQVAVGPLLGGLLVTTFGVRSALAANAISFAISGALLVGLPRIRRDLGKSTRSVRVATVEGLIYAWKTPAIRAVVLGVFLVVAFVAVDNVALVFLVRDVLHTNALGFGIVAAAFGVGMLVASIGLTSRRSISNPALLVLLGWLLSGIGTLATGLAPNVIAAGGMQAMAGVGNGFDNVATPTLIQRLVPPAMLGRVFGLFGTAAFAGSTLAYVLAGVLLDATSPRATLIVGGIGAIASVLLIGPLLWRAIHQISDPAPSP